MSWRKDVRKYRSNIKLQNKCPRGTFSFLRMVPLSFFHLPILEKVFLYFKCTSTT